MAAKRKTTARRQAQHPVAAREAAEAGAPAQLRYGRADDRHEQEDGREDEEIAADRVGRQAALQRACRAEAEGQQQDREGEHDVHRARQRSVDSAAVVARDHAQRHADDHDQAGGEEGGRERYARAVDRAAEDIAPERVGPHDVAVARRRGRAELVERVGVLRVRRMRAEQLHDLAGEDRDDDEQHDDGQRDERDLVAPQPAPEERQRRACSDLACCGGRLIGDRATGVLEQLGSAGAHGLRPCVIYVPR